MGSWRLLAVRGAALLALLGSTRARACLVANQDLRLLLGESQGGLVWAVLELNRREDDRDPAVFWWRLRGRVEVAPADGRPAKVLRGFGRLTAAFKVRESPNANRDPPIEDYVEALARRIQAPGFHRPRALRQYGCDYARACGPWRLQATGDALLADGGDGLRAAISIPEKFVERANLEGSADAESRAYVREDLRLVAITEYDLGARKAFVLNLALGDYGATYGGEEPGPAAAPSPLRLIRQCGGVACYHPPPTMHHGNHLEAGIVADGGRR